MPEVLRTSWCPRCDEPFTANTKAEANRLVREHIVRQEQVDPAHEGALEGWDQNE